MVSIPSFSVVIPAHNSLPYVLLSLQTVMNQSFPPLEVILVDNASTDGTAGVVHREFPQVRVLEELNIGVSAARNRGIQEARGEFIAFLDSDDLWGRFHLEVLAGLIHRHPGVVLVGTVRGRPISDSVVPRERSEIQDFVDDEVPRRQIYRSHKIDYFRRAAGQKSPFNSSSTAVRRSLLLHDGVSFRHYSNNEDLLFWCEAALLGDVAIAEIRTGLQLIRDGSATASLRRQIWKLPEVDCWTYADRPLYRHLNERLRHLDRRQQRSVERYLDGLVTGSWRSTLYYGLQQCARVAIRQFRRPWHPQALIFVTVALIPRSMGRFISRSLQAIRPLDEGRRPLSPFLRGL
jgi:glycosyltransferase involved in cell wall biosynthesis